MPRLNPLGVPIVIAFSALAACGGNGGSSAGGLPPPADTVIISGRLSGMVGSIVLQNNLTDILALNSNGVFVFPTPVPRFGRYSITVATQPSGQTCSVTNHSGVVTADIDFVLVECTVNAYTVGGTVSGLGGSLVLQNNAGSNLTLNSDGAFTFGMGVSHGGPYAVTVLTQPAGQFCGVVNGAGNITSPITNVTVTCADVVMVAPMTGLQAGESCLTLGAGLMTMICTRNVTDPLTGVYAVAGTNDVVSFFPNGVYVYVIGGGDPACGTSHGVEAGAYNYQQQSGSFAVLSNAIDTTGECGLWRDSAGMAGVLMAAGGHLDSGFTLTVDAGQSILVLMPTVNEKL